MPGKFVGSLTRTKDDPDRATVAFVVANAAVASEKKTVVFLSTGDDVVGIALLRQGACPRRVATMLMEQRRA